MTEPTVQETSPLAEVSPTSLEDLFNKDPLELTEKDIEETVRYLRKARETFLKEEATAPKKGDTKKPAVKAGPKVALDKTLTADDLDI
jgi:hypothetical protein